MRWTHAGTAGVILLFSSNDGLGNSFVEDSKLVVTFLLVAMVNTDAFVTLW